MALLLFAIAALVYLAFAQTTLFHSDAHRILRCTDDGLWDYGRHHLSYAALSAFHRFVGEPLGLPAHRVMTAFGAVCTALSVAIAYLAAREVGSRRPVLVAGLFGACLPVFFFATVIEFHAVYLPWAVLCFLACCRAARADSLRWSVAVGALAGVAMQFHATGLALVVTFAPWLVSGGHGTSVRRGLIRFGAAIVAELLVVASFSLLWSALEWRVGRPMPDAMTPLELALYGLSQVHEIAWSEWLWPTAPLSFLFVWAAVRSPVARMARASLVALLPLLLISSAVIGVCELGAYFAPFALPMAILAVRAVPRGVAVAALVVMAVVSGGVAWSHDLDGRAYRGFVAGVRALGGEQPPVLLFYKDRYNVADPHVDESAALLVFAPQIRTIPLMPLATEPLHELREKARATAGFLRASLAGRRVLMGRGSHERLRAAEWPGDVVLDELARVFTFRERHVDGFDGFVLEPR